ncbi:MAG: carbohydrate kinase [Chitinophagaceae bacterium]|nr:carbohydrate kinase [Chitinophagaceae bacterium]
MSRVPVIAVFDIGKTNKKFFLIDEQYKIVYEQTEQFAEIADDEGEPCEDLQKLTAWVQATFRTALRMPGFHFRAVNCTTYGASFVHIDAAGYPVCPLYNYLKPFPRSLQERFYETYGDEKRFAITTASPVLGSLNSGLQLYRIKYERPDLYRRIRYSLHLPQYISYLFSKRASADITSLGCHSGLWDFTRNDYHSWVQREGVDMKFPPLMACNATVQADIERQMILCGGGLHDSSAALIPYLAAFTGPFVLISTGTWCISLNPFNHEPLTGAELQQDCLCYLSYDGLPVKASRLFAGRMHDDQVKRLAAHFQVSVDHYKNIGYDADNVDANTTAFDQADLDMHSNYSQAYHALMQWLVQLQYQCTSLILSGSGVTRIFVDGGFANNPVYMHLLAKAFAGYEVFAASVSQATAIGAALAIHSHWNARPVPGDLVSLKYY